MSVNKLLTFIKHKSDRRKEDNSLLEESEKWLRFIKVTKSKKEIIFDVLVAVMSTQLHGKECTTISRNLSQLDQMQVMHKTRILSGVKIHNLN